VTEQVERDDQDEVVVIEERDTKTLSYIVIAGILGVAIGGLIGSVVTANKWQSAYQALEQQSLHAEKSSSEVVEQKTIEAEQKVADLTAEIEEAELIKLIQENSTLHAQLDETNGHLSEAEKELAEQERQVRLQSTMFERSRELFQRELIIKQELATLRERREVLQPQVERYKKECDIYLEGKSWDAVKDACDKHDEANSKLSQVDQMIEVHKLDLAEISQISEQIGL
jgi:predicted RNase H-like nuclease (RuvC/YqgF family)